MSMEITGILGPGTQIRPGMTEQRTSNAPSPAEQFAQQEAESAERQASRDVEQIIRDIEMAASTLNKRLRYSVNRDSGQVIVKVIDRNTDKVIKELPPEALQRLYVRMREAIGLLIDEEI